MPEKSKPALGPLYDGGLFRAYDNRIEIDRLGFFGGVKRTGIVYYNDVTGVQASRKRLIISRTGWNTSVLDFKDQEQMRKVLNIINSHKA